MRACTYPLLRERWSSLSNRALLQGKKRLAKRGLASADGGVGALYAVVKIEVPKTVGAREQELLEQLAAASNFNPRRHFA